MAAGERRHGVVPVDGYETFFSRKGVRHPAPGAGCAARRPLWKAQGVLHPRRGSVSGNGLKRAWPQPATPVSRRRWPTGWFEGCRSPIPLCFRAIPCQGRPTAGRGLGRCSAPACRRCPLMTFCRPARGGTFTRKTAAIPGVPAKKAGPAGAGFRSERGQGRPIGPAGTLRLVEGRAVGSPQLLRAGHRSHRPRPAARSRARRCRPGSTRWRQSSCCPSWTRRSCRDRRRSTRPLPS